MAERGDQPRPPVQLDRARAFLEARFAGRATDVAEAGAGEWSTAYAYRCDGAGYVIRFGALHDDFEKDRFAARFASAELPIPAVIEIGESFGGYYAISERASGAYLDALDEEGMRATLPSLLATLDAARRADLSATAGFGMWDGQGRAVHRTWRDALLATIGGDRASSRTVGWRDRLAVGPSGIERFDEAYDVMRGLAGRCPDERHLLHNDPLNRNILVHDHRISALLDWGCGMWGDFLYDVAHLAFSVAWYPAWRPIDFAAEARRFYEAAGVSLPGFDERLLCYQLHIGFDACAYNAWKGRWDHVETALRRTQALVRGER